jgi:hypothetical protein
MADSIETIESNIDAQILAAPALVNLNSTSNVAKYKVYRSGIAFILNLFERQQDDYQTNIETIVEQKQFGTDPWWQETMLAYQHGDLLQFINNVFQYPVIDPTKQVINLCAVSGSRGVAVLKCASLVDGVPQPLTDDQIAGALSYAQEQRPCGIDPVVQSYPADLLKLYLNIYYNAQGDLPTIQGFVEAAITSFLTKLDFNGVLYINALIDAIQAIPAIIDDQVFVTQVAAKPSGGAYINITSSYQAQAGYFVIDPDLPLSSTLTYIAA